MSLFKKKDRKPRIAYDEQRNGVKHYYVETWNCYGIAGCMWSQNSKKTTDIKEAKKILKDITDEEIVKYGHLSKEKQ